MKELNWYTGSLFSLGIFALINTILHLDSMQDGSVLFLLILLIVILDFFPIKLPSGDEYITGTAGSLLILFKFGLVPGVLSFILSLFFLSFKKYRSLRRFNWVRYLVTIGMYFICALLAHEVYQLLEPLNVFIRVFIAIAVLETANHFALAGIRKSIDGTPLAYNFKQKMRDLLIPIVVSGIVVANFIYLDDMRHLINGIYYTGFFVLIIIYVSNEFSNVIEKHKKIEEELRATKEQLESFFDHTSDAITISDLNGTILRVNRAFYSIFGWTSDEVLGKPIVQIFPSEADEVNQIMQKVIKGIKVNGYEAMRHRKDGKCIYTSLTLSQIRDSKGNVVAIAGIFRDITQNKQSEEALRESEAKYRLIADNMTDLIGVLDTKGVLQYVSPSYQQVLGLQTVNDQDFQVLKRIHTDDFSHVEKQFSLMLGAKTPKRIEFRFLNGHDEWVILEAHLSPVIGQDEEVMQVVFVVRDITERKQTEDLLQKSDKLSMVGQLAAGVAHEIRNPLTAIRGFAQLFQQGIVKEEYVDIMLSELNRIELIVNEFLMLAKPQSLNFEPKDVRTLLTNTVTLLNSQAILNNIQILTEFDPDVPLIESEENQLKQVFINLLKNAIESMPEGGNIIIQAKQQDTAKVLVRFIDHGTGIHEERLSKLGEPFYTTKEKGTGLGLMVSHKIIHDHRGEIQFISKLNEGTTVDILLPITQQID